MKNTIFDLQLLQLRLLTLHLAIYCTPSAHVKLLRITLLFVNRYQSKHGPHQSSFPLEILIFSKMNCFHKIKVYIRTHNDICTEYLDIQILTISSAKLISKDIGLHYNTLC